MKKIPIVVLFFVVVIALLFATQKTTKLQFEFVNMDEDNFTNNYIANPHVWTQEDAIFIATQQGVFSIQDRKINKTGQEQFSAQNNEKYLLKNFPSESNNILNTVEVWEEPSHTLINKKTGILSPQIFKNTLFYLKRVPDDNYTRGYRVDLFCADVHSNEEMLVYPRVTSYFVYRGKIVISTKGIMSEKQTDRVVGETGVLITLDILSQEVREVCSVSSEGMINYFGDENRVFFSESKKMGYIDLTTNSYTEFMINTHNYYALLNAYNGVLFYATDKLEDGKISCSIIAHDLITNEQKTIYERQLSTPEWDIKLSVFGGDQYLICDGATYWACIGSDKNLYSIIGVRS